MSKSNREQGRAERAAAIQAAHARAERNRRIAIGGAVVVVLAIIAAAVFWYSGGSGGSSTATTKDVAKLHPRAGDHSLVIGPKSAKDHVVVYEDFLCPYCREFETASRDFLHADAAKGLVEVEYRPFHLLQDDYSTRALNAFAEVLSESPGVAMKFHDLLYDKQPYEAAANKPNASQLADWAASVGADKSKVEAAVNAADPAFETAANAAAQKANVQGTPTVYLNGKQVQGSATQIADQLETQIAKK
ncbi:DsbA family protein [Nocardioides terrisoli]|uniref:DsbA family protein n=1 Tax=Nocardioides terrisoli TaxID=3388267 RepID=UPI00287B74EB|nr:thioredoxin domain-containing protein [Nocardioides marmorisolisilvae]